MERIFRKILNEVNRSWLMENTSKLLEIEKGQTFVNYQKAAEFTAGLIKNTGIENCEIINFPADGKTVYQDKRMPLAWYVSKGKLTIKKPDWKFSDPVIADYERHPFHLIKGSISTPKEGLCVRLITENQLFSGEDAEGCLVVLNPFTPPRAKILSAALDFGAIGIISDFLNRRYESPDGIQWVTACTEGVHWHVQSEDRPFIGFSVSPRTGDLLRQAATEGEVTALVECDGVRSEGNLPLVTALIPGRQEKELWILSHLYEPLSDDNSNGVIASIEIARALKKLAKSGTIPPFECSLRLIFAMEMYGFAAFAEKIGTAGREKVIGAINTDSIQVSATSRQSIYLAPPGTAFFGNSLMEKLADECGPFVKATLGRVIEEGMYADDAFLSEPTNGIPTLWSIAPGKWWHNSEQKMNLVEPEIFASAAAFAGAWVSSVISVSDDNVQTVLATSAIYAQKHLLEESKRILNAYVLGEMRWVESLEKEISDRMEYRLKRDAAALADLKKISDKIPTDIEIKKLKAEVKKIISALVCRLNDIKPAAEFVKSDKWFEYSASIVPTRTTIGFPFDLIAVPKNKRIELPDGMIYGPFARILANMDGKKTLKELIREAEWETNTVIGSAKIKKYITAVSYLTDYGYLKTVFKEQYAKNEIVQALKAASVKKGDLLMVHASLSKLGIIKGGVETVIDALRECVGEEGTLLFPAFTNSFIYFEDSPVKGSSYRPYDPSNPDIIWVGSVPKAVLKRKGVLRSAHPTHSVVGFGPLAEKCLAEHQKADPPTCRRSPFGKLLDFKGKILYFGSGLAPTTFLHFLEDELDLPYLGNAICRIKNGDKTRTVLTPKHLPGHRDFYINDAENCKFFSRVIADNLKIKESALGLGKIQLLDAENLYKLGIKAIKAEPNILLCDDPECRFCQQAKKNKKSLGRLWKKSVKKQKI